MNHNIELSHVRSLEEGKEFLATDRGKTIRGVILDIICMKMKNQEVPDNTFIITASQYFVRTLPHLPIVALTGETEEYRRMGYLFKDDMKVFSKGGDEERMFEYLRDKGLNYEKLKIRSNYQDIFETIDRHFDKESEERLVSCLRDMNNNDQTIVTSTLGNLRKLQEGFYIALHELDKTMVPRKLIFNERDEPSVSNERIIKHLTGNFDLDKRMETTKIHFVHGSYMERLLYFVYKGCSGELHFSRQKTSRYTVQALVYSFLDMVLWLRRLVGQSKP